MAQSLSNLPLGAKLKFGKHSISGETAQDIVWLVVSKPGNVVTLITEKVIDLRAMDAREPNNPSIGLQQSGNSRYAHSNLAQWLNSDAVANGWYTAKHSYDQSPTTDYVKNNTPYAGRPGFLNNFSTLEKNAIATTSVVTARHYSQGEGNDTISQKLFIPSMDEVSNKWEYFSSDNFRKAYATDQVKTYSGSGNVVVGQWGTNWWLRDAHNQYAHPFVNSNGLVRNDMGQESYYGEIGVRPAMNLSTSFSISDTTDSSGYYTAVWNSAPNKPSNITVPTIYGGKVSTISWSNTTDPDGDAVTYQLEVSLSGGSYTQLYKGTALSYAHLVPFGTTNVVYRVKAIDTSGESSAYTTSSTITVVNNYAPVISGADANLGVKDSGFTGTYTITDANNNAVTVTESIDGVQIRSLVATLGATITYGITGNTWLTLPNGSHTLTISATDGLDTTVRRYTFTKLVTGFTIQNSTPWVASTKPSRIMLVVTRNLPIEATFKVEVCNNGYDSSPKWEDATDSVRSGLVYQFTNTTKTATNWGVLIRVTVNRNGGTGACYVSNIGGNFE